jgi:hypothetical protein
MLLQTNVKVIVTLNACKNPLEVLTTARLLCALGLVVHGNEFPLPVAGEAVRPPHY